MANIPWIDLFPNIVIHNLDLFGLDHRPIQLKIPQPVHHPHHNHSSLFTFEHKWLFEDDYKDILANAWSSLPAGADLHDRLTTMSKSLKDWAYNKVGDLLRRMKATRKELNMHLNIEDDLYNHEKTQALEASLEKLLY